MVAAGEVFSLTAKILPGLQLSSAAAGHERCICWKETMVIRHERGMPE
jgi:hypothetical protein